MTSTDLRNSLKKIEPQIKINSTFRQVISHERLRAALKEYIQESVIKIRSSRLNCGPAGYIT